MGSDPVCLLHRTLEHAVQLIDIVFIWWNKLMEPMVQLGAPSAVFLVDFHDIAV